MIIDMHRGLSIVGRVEERNPTVMQHFSGRAKIMGVTDAKRIKRVREKLKFTEVNFALTLFIRWRTSYAAALPVTGGFTFPELNQSALHGLKEQVYGCEAGYSTSKTCEIGLALHADIPNRSILYLVDEVTDPLT